jgi:hypothetical protein
MNFGGDRSSSLWLGNASCGRTIWRGGFLKAASPEQPMAALERGVKELSHYRGAGGILKLSALARSARGASASPPRSASR